MANSLLSPKEQSALLNYVRPRFNPPLFSFLPFYVNGLSLGLLNEFFQRRIAEDLKKHVRITSQGLFFNDSDWGEAGQRLQRTARRWWEKKIYGGWRGEDFTVFSPAGEPLFPLERSAFRPFGFKSHAVHINAWRKKDGGTIEHWIAKRSAAKMVAPNKLDNLVGGGVAAGETPILAMAREAFEEAGLTSDLSKKALFSSVRYSERVVQNGVHREYLHVFNLEVPASFTPHNQDGEVASFCTMTTEEVIGAVTEDQFMPDSVISLLTLFQDLELLPEVSPLAAWLATLKV